jgi:hypothetical protein
VGYFCNFQEKAAQSKETIIIGRKFAQSGHPALNSQSCQAPISKSLTRNSDEERPELGEKSEEDHDQASKLDHPSAANLKTRVT